MPRKAGWDCHGLPVELEIERELGLASKADIEEYGIEKFNARCRESVFRYVEEQVFRFNNRCVRDGDRFKGVLSGITGKRLTYRDLIGADMDPATT